MYVYIYIYMRVAPRPPRLALHEIVATAAAVAAGARDGGDAARGGLLVRDALGAAETDGGDGGGSAVAGGDADVRAGDARRRATALAAATVAAAWNALAVGDARACGAEMTRDGYCVLLRSCVRRAGGVVCTRADGNGRMATGGSFVWRCDSNARSEVVGERRAKLPSLLC